MENIHHSYLIVKNGFATVSTEIRQSLFFPPPNNGFEYGNEYTKKKYCH